MPVQRSVLIVDDHDIVVQGIESLLEEQERYKVAGLAKDGREGIALVKEKSPDLIIMDISMPGMDGIEATREIKKIAPETPIIIYTMYSEPVWVVELIKEGISAYVLKDGPTSDLILAMEVAESGATYFSSVAPALLVDHLGEQGESDNAPDHLEDLSAREREVFQLLANGDSVKSVADALYISSRTVETHKYNIMKKLKAESLADLTKIAMKHKLIS